MRIRGLAVAGLLALGAGLGSCGRLGSEKEEGPGVDPAVVERVARDVLATLAARKDEVGPLFVHDIPKIKDDAARRAGFDGWNDLKRRMERTDADLEVRLAERITLRIRELLE